MAAPPEVQKGVAMPEWLTRKDAQQGAWVVQEGPAQRGEAWTQIRDRIMRVPFGGDETNRLIRAHEMMHAKVSPAVRLGTELGISDEAIQAAEEFRVNTLVTHAGFDLDALVDGSERLSGQRLATMGDMRNLVFSLVATAGGKAATDFLRGVRNVDPNLAKVLRGLEKTLLKEWKTDLKRRGGKRAAAKWADTAIVPDGAMSGYPRGYASITIPIARTIDNMVDALTAARANEDGEDGKQEANDADKNEVDPNLAQEMMRQHNDWAAEVHFGALRLPRKVKGAVGRRRVAANAGVNPRRLNRLLTDPQRRVFDRNIRSNGGMIVIDLSGSMRVTTKELESMMEASPGCTIVGYSYSSVTTANAWVLARDGRRCEDLPRAGAGNGIDGPIIRWAIANAKHNEPIVWICDGMVTGKNDDAALNLDLECAGLVRRHNIHMVRDIDEGVKAVTALAGGKKLPTTYTGPVRRAAVRLGFTV